MEENRKTVKVFCRVANGVELRLTKDGYDDGTGFHHKIQYGEPVVLGGPSALHAGVNDHALHSPTAAAENEVDANFWAEWAKQNERNPLLAQGMIFSPDETKGDAKDNADAAIARTRLVELEAKPETLIQGEALQERLEGME
jgi:hypothetical protein